MPNKKQFNTKTFMALGINYVIGFGFVTTITQVTSFGWWGLLVFVLVALFTLASAFVFSRLTNEYPNEIGSSFSYANKLKKPAFSFFIGWNQYISGPLLAGSGALFLTSIADVFVKDSVLTDSQKSIIINVVRVLSILFFVALIFSSTLGLKFSKKLIFFNMAIKWSVLIIGMVSFVALAEKQGLLAKNFADAASKKIDTYIIMQNVLLFSFAFRGMESLPSFSNQVKTKNFKLAMLGIFLFIFTFYLFGYILFASTNLVSAPGSAFLLIYRLTFGLTGVILFAIYLVTYNIASLLTTTLSNARILASLSEERYLPVSLSKLNKKNEYKNAIWFNFGLTILSLLVFTLIPLLTVQSDGKNSVNYFNKVVELGTIAFFMQSLGTFVTALVLAYQKRIAPIPWYEQATYYFSIIFILIVTLVNFIPPIGGKNTFTLGDGITLISYAISMIFGFALYLYSWHFKKKEHIQIEKEHSTKDLSRYELEKLGLKTNDIDSDYVSES
ncbi:APC family permease [Mycoplasma corogypsi]|uniref:APC family permease n=1 Tax=Mycoplasma corogypsi TaxID=2106 RepID=UPI003872F0A6